MMHEPTQRRFERLAFVLLIVAGFTLGYWMAPKSSIERQRVGTKNGTKVQVAGLAPAIAGGEHDVNAMNAVVLSGDARVDRQRIHQQILTALNEPISTERWMLLAGILQNLSSSNWKGVLQALDDERKLHGRDHADARSFFVRRAGEVIGLEAVSYFLEAKDSAAARSALTGWASKNPAEALAWLSRQSQETGSAPFVGDAIRGLALVEPDLAISFLENVPLAERTKYTANLVPTLVRTAGVEQTQRLVDDMIARATTAGAQNERYLAEIFRDLTDIKSKRANVSGNIEPAIAWLDQHIGQPYLDGYAVRNAAAQFAKQDPLKTIAWLDSVNARAKFPPFTAVGYGYVLDAWTHNAGLGPAANWLAGNTGHPSYDRIASHFSELAVVTDANLATKFAESIKEPAIRAAALKQIQKARTAQATKKK